MSDSVSNSGVLPRADAKRLRIAVLNRVFRPTGGGAERYSIALVEQLALHHDVHVFAQTIDHQRPGVTYHPVAGGVTRPRWVNQLWFAIATWWATRRGFDVVHSHENTWHGQVQTVHVLPVKYNLLHGRTGFAKLVRWVKIATSPRLLTYLALEHLRYRAHPARHVVATSNSLRSIMVQTYPHVAPMLSVITPGVPDVPPLTTEAERHAAREALDLPVRGRYIVFVGNDYRKKGLPSLIEALVHLPQDVHIAVVGNPAHIPAMRILANEAAVSTRVHFLGALESVDVVYRAANVLAHPTLEDTFAMVVLEAMAFGLPVVVSGARYCGIAELLTTEVDALVLHDPHDVAALNAALARLLNDAELAERLRQSGRAFAQRHVWAEIARQQDAIYKAATGL